MKTINKYLIEQILPVPENWEIYQTGPETADRSKSANKFQWIFYVGGNDWEPNFKFSAVYAQQKYDKQGESIRVWIEVKYPPELEKIEEPASHDVQISKTEFGKKVANVWLSKAKKLRAEHVRQETEYNEIMDKENKKLDIARDKGKVYNRKLPNFPVFDGNWADAFVLALRDPELKNYIKRWSIDKTVWNPASKFIYNRYEEK